MDLYLEGSKGGEDKAHTPVEAPNNLLSVAYAKVLLAVAEGELSGVPTGKDIFLNGTPLLAADGTPNFGGVTWDWRPGTVDQTYIQGMPSVSSETSVGVELTNTTPYVRQITKTSLSAVRVTLAWPALMKQESNGDTNGVTIDYAIDVATNGGAYVLYKQYQVSGKTNTDYERTHRVDLPKGATNWTLRVRRITPNSESSLIQDTMNIKSYAEVVDAKQKYPNTALLFVQFDSRLFGGGSIPKISVKVKGRLVRVPTNYEPTTRTYSGVWDGTFKWAYTNNPAWIFFDIVTQNRFGLGNRVNLNQVDKWELYEVAQYCDVLVDDGTGAGTKEPRHTCNIYIQSQEDAWTVLRDICSIFNGMTYWDGNAFVARADKQEPLDNIPLFGRSNVIGDFNYQTTDERTIFTSALVSYDEPTDHYGTQVEAVWEKSQILRWGGDRQTTLAAVGCTSRGEAQRKGKYTLITNMFNRSVTFKTGLQGLDPKVRPGAIIGVADPLIAGKEFTGRMTAATLKVVTLDRVTEAKAGDKLYITRKDGSQEARTVQAAAGKVITLTTNYSEIALPNSVWYLEAEDLKSQLFKIVKLKFDGAACEVSGIEYNDSKFGAVDNGARLEPRPISKTPPQAQKPPSAVYVTSRTYTEQMMAVTAMTVTWPKTENAVLYEGQWRVGQGDWVSAGTTGATQFEIKGIYSGQYVARVRAINALDIKSGWTLSEATQLNGKVGSPPSLASLTVDPLVFGMRLKWTFAPNSEDTARTEIMYSPTASFASATKLGDFAYPQVTHDINGLKAGQQFFFWARIVDKSGNVGPYFPLTTQNGVMGLSSTDFNEYEEYFKDQISESALGQQLAERIDLIDGPATMIGSVNERVKTVSDQVTQVNTDLSEQLSDTNALIDQTNTSLDATNAQIIADKAALQAQIDATNQTVTTVTGDLQTQIDAIEQMADSIDYVATDTYTTGQSVMGSNGRLYQAKQNVPINTPPPNTTYWTDIGQVVSSADGLAARVSTVETTVTNQDGRITANANAITGLTSSLAGKADAAALTSLTTRVTSVEGTVTSQGSAITGLTNSLTTTNSNVTAAQTAANNANTLAGGKGKVFYGTSAPAVGEQLSQNLWIDTNGGANTPKRWNGSAWVAVTDKVATDAAAAAANALSVAQTKADASAVTALTTRVTNAEGSITSQGNSITSLNNSLTTTNGNVTAAAAAAQAASDLAGGKGEVIYSASAPAVAKQLSQNLWIDITGGANTPKRWNGSAWVAVTDKIATDAAAAAASALSLVATKADSSALTALSNTVTQQGNTLTAQGNSITSINATIGSMSGNGTNLLNDVYSWLTSTTPPTVALSTATSFTGVAVTGSASGFGYRYVRPNVASPWFMFCPTNNTAGWNIPLVPGKYLMSFYASTDTQGVTDGLVIRAAMWDGSSRSPTDFTLTTTRTRYTALITITNSNTYGFTLFFPVGVSGNVAIIDSPMVEKQVGTGLEPSPFTPGNSALSVTTNATAVSSLTARVTTAEGTIVSQGNAITGLTSTVAGKADTTALNSLTTRVTTAEGLITSQGNAITSLTSTVAGKADTSAVNALTTRVTAAEGTITAHTNSITSLSASVNNATQENVLLNPDWNASGALLTESNSTFITEYFDRAQGPAGSPADRLLCRTRVGSTTGWGGFALNSRNGTIYTPAIAGEVINLEVQMFCENAVANAGKICITPWDSVNGSIVGNVRILGYDAVVGGWQKLSTQYTLPAGTASFSIYVTPEGVSPVGFKMWLANLKVTRQTVDGSVSAKATSALDARVSTVEGTVTSQATSITNLNSVVSGIGGNGSNLVPAEYSVFNAIKPEIIYGGSIATTAVDVGAMNGYALKVTTNSTTTSATIYTAVADTYAAYNMASKQGKYILSYYAKAETEGHTIALFLRGRNSADVAVSSSGASQDALTTTWTRYSQVVDLTGVTFADKDKMTIGIQVNRSGVTGRVFYIDRIMLEPLVGTNTTPSTFSIGNSAAKLDALSSATTALTTRVTTAEGNITTQASNLTNLASSIGGNGSNLLSDVYSWITSLTLPVCTLSSATVTGIAIPEATSGFGYKMVSTTTNTGGWVMLAPSNSAAGWNMPLEAGNYLVSFWASSPTVGATLRMRLYSSTTSAYSVTVPLTTTRTRYTHVVSQAVPATQAILFYNNMAGISGTEMIVDSVMVEKQVGTGVVASPFVPGTSAQSATANATATAALTTRVTAAEGTITSQGSSITTLTNSLTTTNGNVTAAQTALNALTTRVTTAEGTITSQGSSITSINASIAGMTPDNLVIDPTFNAGKAGLINTSTVTIVTRTDASVPANTSVPRVAQWAVPTSSGNTYLGWGPVVEQKYPGQNNFIAMAPGEVYEVSCDVFMEASGGTRQHGIWMQFYDVALASISHNWVTGTISTTNGAWKTITGKVTVPDTVVMGRPALRASLGNATNIWIANMRWTKQNPTDAATASALATLDATVTQQGTTITSQGSAVTALQSTVGAIGGSGTNLIPAEYCSFTSVLPTFNKGAPVLMTAEVDTSAYSGYLLKAASTTATTAYVYLAGTTTDYNMRVAPSKKYIVSFWAKGSADHNVGVRFRFPNSTGGVTETQLATVAITTTLTRYSAVVTTPSTLVDRACIVLFTQNTAAIGDTWFDGFMLEAQIGTATEASNFVPGTSTRQASAQASAISSLDTRVTSTEGVVSAQATKLDGVFLQVNPAMSGDSSGFAGDDSATVGVWTEQTARIDDDIAIGKRVDNVMAQVDDALAVIQSEAIARADADSALATTIDRVQVSANNANAAVQTVSQAQVTADGKASAMWSVKLQVNQWGQYAVAGVGLGLENTGAGLQSYFLVNANNFYISNGVNANVAVPFAVVGGQTFISSAVIQDASITMLKIGDNLQSDNYVAGVTGWRMLKSGVFEINGYIAGQGRMTMTNRSLRVYDGNGVKRVQLGDLSE